MEHGALGVRCQVSGVRSKEPGVRSQKTEESRQRAAKKSDILISNFVFYLLQQMTAKRSDLMTPQAYD